LRDIAGYRDRYVTNDDRRWTHIRRTDCECWLERDGLLVELHWSIMQRYFCVPLTLEEMWPRLVPSSFEGLEIQDLAPEDLFLCLALHACKHRWDTLLLLSDLAALLRRYPNLDWDFLRQQARRLHVERIVAITLQLVERLFGPAGVPEFGPAKSRPVEKLCDRIQAGLQKESDEPFQGFWNYLQLLNCRERVRDRWGQAVQHLLVPGVAEWDSSKRALPAFCYLPAHMGRLAAKVLR
jgi:hypothetical protein